MADTGPYNLQRFLDAQAATYKQAREELRHGNKTGHWMWFIFPQIKGLGSSPTAQYYAITSRDEAVAYLDHELLGPRLGECTQLVNLVGGKTSEQIFGPVDSLKFRSSMTLFSYSTTANQLFEAALAKYFSGQPDPLTLQRL